MGHPEQNSDDEMYTQTLQTQLPECVEYEPQQNCEQIVTSRQQQTQNPQVRKY